MKVNNVYELGQKVYFINDKDKAQMDTVRSIQVFVYRNKTNIYYYTSKF